MFTMTMSTTFAIGATEPVRIHQNGTTLETTLTWRDAQTLVIGGTDRRRILHTSEANGLRQFVCNDPAEAPDRPPTFTVITADALGRPVALVLANLAPESE